eukprot:scaffold205764_cov16-Tisochrysis_lutea.AAC.2
MPSAQAPRWDAAAHPHFDSHVNAVTLAGRLAHPGLKPKGMSFVPTGGTANYSPECHDLMSDRSAHIA